MERILRDVEGTIRLEVLDGAGDPVDADAPPTAEVVDSADAAVAGSPFASAQPAGAVGVYEVALTLSTLDAYRATWTGTVAGKPATWRTAFEVVGGFLFTLAELRASDPALADEERYPAAALRKARQAAEERLEELCQIAFVPRGRRVTLSGVGSGLLLLPDMEPTRIVSAAVGGTALTADELAGVAPLAWGAAARAAGAIWARGDRNVTLLYEHGLPAAPEPVRRAGLTLAKAQLIRSPVPDRATSESSDAGTIRYSVAGRDGPTGFPEVDAVIEQFGQGIPATG